MCPYTCALVTNCVHATDLRSHVCVCAAERRLCCTNNILILGYAGVYSSFLLFAQRAAKKYGISSRDILVEMGRMKAVLLFLVANRAQGRLHEEKKKSPFLPRSCIYEYGRYCC